MSFCLVRVKLYWVTLIIEWVVTRVTVGSFNLWPRLAGLLKYQLAAMCVGSKLEILSCMGLRCLIVDDNPEFLKAATDLLQRQGLTVVGVASNIADALKKASELQPEVSLVDIDLGDESGLDLAVHLASAPSQKRSQVILISAYSEMDYADLIAASPAVGFLSKSDLSGKAVQETLNSSSRG
jgi:CheY-like chemotaxis protein